MGKNSLNARLLAMMDAAGVRFVESGDDGGGGSGSDRGDDTGGQDGAEGGGEGGSDRDDTDDDGDEGDDEVEFDALPKRTQREIKKLRREGQRKADEARTARQERDAARDTAQKISKLVNGESDDDADPDKLTDKVTKLTDENRTLRVERAAERAIRKHNGDVDAVLDSRSFADRLSKLDPADDGFGDALDGLAKETVESADRYKAATPKRGGSGSGEHGGRKTDERPKSLRDAYGARNKRNR
jgi:hypothetical protein